MSCSCHSGPLYVHVNVAFCCTCLNYFPVGSFMFDPFDKVDNIEGVSMTKTKSKKTCVLKFILAYNYSIGSSFHCGWIWLGRFWVKGEESLTMLERDYSIQPVPLFYKQ